MSAGAPAAPIVPVFLTAILCLTARADASGVICGEVHDAVSGAPVAQAIVLVRTPSGAYTGIYAVTDNNGHFCAGGIPAGNYDLEVRVNDHTVAFVRNVAVTDETTGVDIGVSLAWALDPPIPNPAIRDMKIAFRVASPSPITIEVIDLQGRIVKAWRSTLEAPGDHRFAWDLRDVNGRPIAPGRYLVRMRAGTFIQVHPFVRVR